MIYSKEDNDKIINCILNCIEFIYNIIKIFLIIFFIFLWLDWKGDVIVIYVYKRSLFY